VNVAGKDQPRKRVRTRGGLRNRVQRPLPPLPPQSSATWNGTIPTRLNPSFTGNAGVKVNLQHDCKPLDAVKLFITEEFMDLLITQTNLYAAQFISRESKKTNPSYRIKEWNQVSQKEMWNFLGLSLLMGLEKKPTIPHYWSKDELFHNSIFNAVMGRNRYQLIHAYLHFADNSKNDGDRMYKVRPMVEYLIEKFKAAYQPTQNISIDEQLLLHKGRLGFKQYIPNKRARFGIKMFSLCDETG